MVGLFWEKLENMSMCVNILYVLVLSNLYRNITQFGYG